MKTTLVIILLLLATVIISAQTTHSIEVSGFSYSPATLNANIDDSVKFNGTASHPVLQVSEATWNSDGTAALSGGFSFPSGSGKIKLTEAGTIYYVCTSHVASHGMKGKIIVSGATLIDNTEGPKFNIYPVPLSGNDLTIEMNTVKQAFLLIDIFDVAGRLVLTSKGITDDGKFHLNCEKLNSGVFLMKIYADGETYVTKFSK